MEFYFFTKLGIHAAIPTALYFKSTHAMINIRKFLLETMIVMVLQPLFMLLLLLKC